MYTVGVKVNDLFDFWACQPIYINVIDTSWFRASEVLMVLGLWIRRPYYDHI